MPATNRPHAVEPDANCGPRAYAMKDDGWRPPVVEHNKERWPRDSMFASAPLAGMDGGRGHWRGLDGPPMPTTSK
jgi:hypothetical protein